MNALWSLVNLLVYTQFVACRDFYIGMFRQNDFLVAQDTIYKEPSPFGGFTTASYGRLFKCPITYFRVVDRLGQGRGPITTIVRGGLRKKYISVRIKSTYRLPVSVNIYVGCENKQPSTFRRPSRTTHEVTSSDASSDPTTDSDGDVTTTTSDTGSHTTNSDSDATTDPNKGGDDPATTNANGGDATTEPAPEPTEEPT